MKQRLAVGLLLASVVLVYGNTLRNSFTQDDQFYISQNPQVTDLSIRELFEPHPISKVFRPVTFSTYALNWALEGEVTWGYHLVNLLLHAAVTWLLYLFLETGLVLLPQRKTVAFVAAWLFALHPIHTEAVASISGRPELLAAAFLLAACLLHFSDREIPSLICFVLAVLSKESAIVFLPLVLVCDYARSQWKSPGRYARLAAMTALYIGLLWKVQGGQFGQPGNAMDVLDNPLAGLTVTWRVLNAIRLAWKYVALQLYPRTLSCDYSFNQIPIYLNLRHTLAAAIAAALALALWAWAVRKRWPGPVLAGGIYLAGFATTANILISIGTIMGERLAYLSSAGLCLLAALGWTWLWKSGQANILRQRVAFALLAVVLVAFAARTVARNLDWKDDRTLYSSGLRASPGSAKMHCAMGDIYASDGEDDLARNEYETALRIYPDYLDALEAYGGMEFRLGRYEAAGYMLEKAFYSTGRYNRNYDFMLVNLAAVYVQTNHLDGALTLLDREITDSPKYSRAWSNRAVVYYKSGNTAGASSDAKTALNLDPGNTQAQTVLNLLSAPPSAAPAPK